MITARLILSTGFPAELTNTALNLSSRHKSPATWCPGSCCPLQKQPASYHNTPPTIFQQAMCPIGLLTTSISEIAQDRQIDSSDSSQSNVSIS